MFGERDYIKICSQNGCDIINNLLDEYQTKDYKQLSLEVLSGKIDIKSILSIHEIEEFEKYQNKEKEILILKRIEALQKTQLEETIKNIKYQEDLKSLQILEFADRLRYLYNGD